MRERGLEFRVGVLLVTAAVILAGFLIVLGNFSFKPGSTFYVDYDYIGNLQAGAPVKVSGIKLGKVKSVEFWGGKVDPKTQRRVQVRLTVWLENQALASVHPDAEFFINTAGVLGEQYLEVVPGRQIDGPPLKGGDIRIGANPPRTDLLMSRLQDVLDNLATVLRDEKQTIAALLKNAASAVEQVNGLLVDNRAQIGELLVNGAKLANEATTTLGKVNAGLEPRAIGSLMRNTDGLVQTARGSLTTLTPQASTLLVDASRVTGLLTEGRLDRGIAAIDKAGSAASQADGLLQNVNGMVTDLRAGKGTAGGLLAKDDIYADLRELIRDLRRNPWKLFWKE